MQNEYTWITSRQCSVGDVIHSQELPEFYDKDGHAAFKVVSVEPYPDSPNYTIKTVPCAAKFFTLRMDHTAHIGQVFTAAGMPPEMQKVSRFFKVTHTPVQMATGSGGYAVTLQACDEPARVVTHTPIDTPMPVAPPAPAVTLEHLAGELRAIRAELHDLRTMLQGSGEVMCVGV